MAIYKPSNLSPNLQEIDLTTPNTFSCQINTSGESAKAYKYEFLNKNSTEKVYESNGIDLATPIKNKGTLYISNIDSNLSDNLVNGKDYLWGVRVYDAPLNSQDRPITKVCSGFLVGSTNYVIWTTNNDILEYDKYIEFETTGPAQIMPILPPNEENIQLPKEDEVYRERKKIDWVEKDLGFEKQITKIECVDGFKYNYINDTPFKIFLCGDEHTTTSVYADPNSKIENSNWIIIYENSEDAQKAHDAGDTPDKTTITPREKGRIITGYSIDTGEIRVKDPFEKIPVNGNAYLLFEYDRVDKTYTEIESDVSQVIGGEAITNDSFKIITNLWTEDKKQLFIQPNINIKSDDTNPDEIVFDNNNERIDIIKTTSTDIIPDKDVDITIEKLDNTQWLLKYLKAVNDVTPPIIPGSNYSVYTDFMDSSPYSYIYARKAPVLTMQYKNYSGIEANEPYVNIDSTAKAWRDISFYTKWESENKTQVKYYQYLLYDYNKELIAQSEELYDNELTWYFRGFQSGEDEQNPEKYYIKIRIVDEYDKEYQKESEIFIWYEIEEGIIPIGIDIDCDEKALKVEVVAPVYVKSTDNGDKKTVTFEDLKQSDGDYLKIPENKVLNYTTVINEENEPIIIPKEFTYLTQFQITNTFIENIPIGDSVTLTEVAHKISDGIFDYFTLKLYSCVRYYFDENNKIAIFPDQFKIKLFKNNNPTPLVCFNNMTQDYIYLKDLIPQIIIPQNGFSYSLRGENEFIILDALPIYGEEDKNYVLTRDYNLQGTTYLQGIYNFKNYKWVPNYEEEFIFLENLSQIDNLTFEDLKVPNNAQGENGELKFIEEGNIWVDSGDYIDRINTNLISSKWFTFFMKVKNDDAGQEQVDCQFISNNKRIIGERR